MLEHEYNSEAILLDMIDGVDLEIVDNDREELAV